MSDFNWGSDDSTTLTTPKGKKSKSGSGWALTFVIAGVIALVLGLGGGFVGAQLVPVEAEPEVTLPAETIDL
jgi:hypothetical protein